jgi:hypothetical protein
MRDLNQLTRYRLIDAEPLAELLDQAYGHVPTGTLADQIHCALLRDQEEGHEQ